MKTTAFGTMDVPAPRFRNMTPAANAQIRLNVTEDMVFFGIDSHFRF
jgi:hypothetical protein